VHLDTTSMLLVADESVRGLPHSKTLAREPRCLVIPTGFGVRQSSDALDFATPVVAASRRARYYQTSKKAVDRRRALYQSIRIRWYNGTHCEWLRDWPDDATATGSERKRGDQVPSPAPKFFGGKW